MRIDIEKVNNLLKVLKKVRRGYERENIFILDFESLLDGKEPNIFINTQHNSWEIGKSFMINPAFEPKEALVDGTVYIETVLYLFALWAYKYITGEPYEMNLSKVKYPGLFQFFSKLLRDDFRDRISDFDELELYLNIALEEYSGVNYKTLSNGRFFLEGRTTVGMIRYENQDSFDFHLDEKNAIVAVADGMGGGSYGDVASRIAINSIMLKRAELWKLSDDEVDGMLRDVFMEINDKIVQYKNRENLKSMGTTLSVLLVKENKLYFAHVGDSRIYLKFRDENQYKQITLDHSLVEVEYREGKLNKEEKEKMAKNILAFALGSDNIKKSDVNTTADFNGDLRCEEVDEAILCSDGCWDIVDKKYFLNGVDILFEKATESIMHDNMTVVKLKIENMKKFYPVQTTGYVNIRHHEKKGYRDILFYIFIILIFILMIVPVFFVHSNDKIGRVRMGSEVKDVKKVKTVRQIHEDGLKAKSIGKNQ